MTVGALIQLEYGNTERMAFLTQNPQITHFKSVYKKYTNFATQFITLQPYAKSAVLSWEQDTSYTFKVPRDGDAIRDMYLTVELPDIYSDSNYQFQWIKRIGVSCITIQPAPLLSYSPIWKAVQNSSRDILLSGRLYNGRIIASSNLRLIHTHPRAAAPATSPNYAAPLDTPHSALAAGVDTPQPAALCNCQLRVSQA